MQDFAGVDGELDGQTGIGARCAIQQRRQPGHCRDPRRAKADMAGQRFPGADALTDFRGERHHLGGVVRQFVALGGQSDLSRGTIEQRDAEFLSSSRMRAETAGWDVSRWRAAAWKLPSRAIQYSASNCRKFMAGTIAALRDQHMCQHGGADDESTDDRRRGGYFVEGEPDPERRERDLQRVDQG